MRPSLSSFAQQFVAIHSIIMQRMDLQLAGLFSLENEYINQKQATKSIAI